MKNNIIYQDISDFMCNISANPTPFLEITPTKESPYSKLEYVLVKPRYIPMFLYRYILKKVVVFKEYWKKYEWGEAHFNLEVKERKR